MCLLWKYKILFFVMLVFPSIFPKLMNNFKKCLEIEKSHYDPAWFHYEPSPSLITRSICNIYMKNFPRTFLLEKYFHNRIWILFISVLILRRNFAFHFKFVNRIRIIIIYSRIIMSITKIMILFITIIIWWNSLILWFRIMIFHKKHYFH